MSWKLISTLLEIAPQLRKSEVSEANKGLEDFISSQNILRDVLARPINALVGV